MFETTLFPVFSMEYLKIPYPPNTNAVMVKIIMVYVPKSIDNGENTANKGLKWSEKA